MQKRFITLEGPDGSGKSSVLKALARRIQTDYQLPLVLTREPGGSPIAEQIRQVILDPGNQAMDPGTEALLYAASRRQHLRETILPAIASGHWVFSDRFVHSSLVYQGVARQLGMDKIWQINQFAIEGLMPELTLLIDVPAEVGLQRIHASRHLRQFDRLDQEDLAFHQEVRQAFLDLAERDPQIETLDGTQPLEAVVEACIQVLKARGVLTQEGVE